MSATATTTAAGAFDILPPRTRLLLQAPVLGMLLRLAAPNLAEAVARIAFITADGVFVARLGGDALAAVSVVFPFVFVLHTITSNLGLGVAAGIGRAMGAGEVARAHRLAGTAIVLGLFGAMLTTGGMLLIGPVLYAAMGLHGAALELAVTYGALVFGGSLVFWLMNLQVNIARGAGSMAVSAAAIAIGELFHLALSPVLTLGWGPIPALGIAGAAVAVLAAYAVGAAILAMHLLSRRALVRVDWRLIRLDPAAATAILRIGGVAAGSALVFQATTFAVTALIGHLGNTAIAAYGAATRLELIQLPVTSAFGSAVITMVATALGAGDLRRAARVTWIAVAVGGAIGLPFALIALTGDWWIGLFSNDPEIRALGGLYLLTQAAVLPLFGAGFIGYCASTAMGDVGRPFRVITLRLIFTVLGGWLALRLGGGALGLFVISGVGTALLGLGLVDAVRRRLRV